VPFDLVAVMGSLLDQAAALAEHRGLLIAYEAITPPLLQFSPPLVQPKKATSATDQLIPHRRRDANFMVSNNPFANKDAISDKHARRIHLAIDGRASIAALSAATGMSMKDTYEALRKLLQQNRIELYAPDGQPVNDPFFPQ